MGAFIPVVQLRSAWEPVMRTLRFCVCTLLLGGSSLAWGQYQGPVPRGPGRRQWAQPPAQVSPNSPRVTPNSRELESEATELARLAQSAADDVHIATSRGMISKELNEKLKRIEKLAKKLRSGLQP